MTKHMGHHGPPSSYVADGGTWPDGPLKKGAPPEAVVAQTIAKAFRDRYEIKDWNPTVNGQWDLPSGGQQNCP